MKTFKTRHQFYLPDDLSQALDRLCASSGSSKTAVLTEGLKAVLERRAGHELDLRFGVRLDRMSRGQERLEGKVDLLPEAFGTFAHHQLTLVAHQPPFDDGHGSSGLSDTKRSSIWLDAGSPQTQSCASRASVSRQLIRKPREAAKFVAVPHS